jgi:hypothetical protein
MSATLLVPSCILLSSTLTNAEHMMLLAVGSVFPCVTAAQLNFKLQTRPESASVLHFIKLSALAATANVLLTHCQRSGPIKVQPDLQDLPSAVLAGASGTTQLPPLTHMLHALRAHWRNTA